LKRCQATGETVPISLTLEEIYQQFGESTPPPAIFIRALTNGDPASLRDWIPSSPISVWQFHHG
jgi:hypothetical protein